MRYLIIAEIAISLLCWDKTDDIDAEKTGMKRTSRAAGGSEEPDPGLQASVTKTAEFSYKNVENHFPWTEPVIFHRSTCSVNLF